jgi:hypothetical protein
MHNAQRIVCWLTAALMLGGVAGCAQFSVPEKIKLPGQDEKPQTPLRMTALWTDTVLVEAGVVGFGGRILFYGTDKDNPIMVDGELTVFAYDDTSEVPEENVPARKYIFRTEELSKHYSKSTLGHSYSFWVPWDKVGGPQKQISLIARFKSAKGGVVMSEMTRHLLPGAAPQAPPAARPPVAAGALAARMAQAKAAQQAIVSQTAPPGRTAGMATTTITLPQSVSDQARNVPQNVTAGAAAGLQDPMAGAAAAIKTPAAAAGSSEAAEIQALVEELRALHRDSEPPTQAQPADRFARRPRRARSEPRSTPVRGPARTPPHHAGPSSDPHSTLPAAPSTGSAT